MLELNKNDFKSKEEVESQIKKYKDWFSGALSGIKKPSVSSEILNIVESGLGWSFVNKTSQEIKSVKLEEEELIRTQSYQENLDLWKNEFLRPIRDSKLQKTDLPFMLSDYPISESEKNELLTYRQYLRDVISTVKEYSEDFQWRQEPYFIQ